MNTAQVAEITSYSLHMETIGDRIEQLLSARGWSYKELSVRSNLSVAFISRTLGKFRDKPSKADINSLSAVRIAEAARVNVAWLLTGEGPRDLPASADDSRSLTIGNQTRESGNEELRLRIVPGTGPELRFGALVEWPALETQARRLRPLHPAWVWARVAATPPFLAVPPDAETVAAVADLIRWSESAGRGAGEDGGSSETTH